jgi:predicted TIM-barrel fold metal-dependent hydrolase
LKSETMDTTLTVPRIISVDDHVVEPPDLWQKYLPAHAKKSGPLVKRLKGRYTFSVRSGTYTFIDDDAGSPADCWHYEDRRIPLYTGMAAAGLPIESHNEWGVLTYDAIRPGCYRQAERLEDMDTNNVEASLCFPFFPRFCGQTFLEAHDKELALLCVRAYNDWMIDEWCAGDGLGRLIPLTLIPLWDVELACEEVERCSAKGSHALSFCESPQTLGLPSMYSGYWDKLWKTCSDTNTVVNMHVGSSSQLRSSADDQPLAVVQVFFHDAGATALVDWLLSGALERFPALRIALSEAQVGWMPFLLQQMDHSWESSRVHGGLVDRLTRPPSEYLPGRVFGCIVDDLHGLQVRSIIGMDQIMFETDFPHSASTWPNSTKTAEELVTRAGLSQSEVNKFIRGNAIHCYDLGRYGIKS